MDYAIVSIYVSVFSLSVAALALGWNIYRDIILKPRVKVDLSISKILTPGSTDKPTCIALMVTNYGPGDIKLGMMQLKNSNLLLRLTGKVKQAVIIEDYTNPLNVRLPAKLEMGDRITLFLPYTTKSFLSSPCTHFGIADYFGRIHWASKKQLRLAQQTYKKDFGNPGSR